MSGRSHFIGGNWIEGAGERFESTDPALGGVNWSGRHATGEEVDAAVAAARNAFAGWAELSMVARIEHLQRFAEHIKASRADLAECISSETGKPRWEALTEVDAMAGKVGISIEAHGELRNERVRDIAGARGATRFKPHGVLAVLGPFNMPGHLPNGHIVPALLAGNTVVFKPSELTPLVGQKTVEVWEQSSLPAGVLNLVQGARETGSALAGHPGIDGLLFTGSAAVGKALSRVFADTPGKMLALEMGGNNPLVVWDVANLDAAAYLTIQSAFITSGQRCSCARRLIVQHGARGDALLDRLLALMRRVAVCRYTDIPEPFMGTVISNRAVDQLLSAQTELVRRGGRILQEMARLDPSAPLLSPGLINMTDATDPPDEELFGPLLQVICVADFEAAMREANNTAYGLVAGLLSDDRPLWERFFRSTRAGVVHWNRQTTNASSYLPFGGTGLSGNHRPSGYSAAEYCSSPVAVIEKDMLSMPQQLPPGISP